MVKKSLAEQIASLSKPQTDFDIEDNEFNQQHDQSGSDKDGSDEFDESDDELEKQHYVKVNKSKLRSVHDDEENQAMLQGKYKGSKVDRSALIDGEDEEEEDEEEEVSGDDDGEVSGDDGELSGDDEELSGEEDVVSDVSDVSDDDEASGKDIDNESIKRSKLKSLMNNERKHIINRLSTSTITDSIKGYQILQQHKLFDSIIDSRLKIQKAITNSNQLPINHKAMIKSNELNLITDKTPTLINESIEKTYDLLDSIFQLRSKILSQDSIITKPPAKINPKKRSLESYLTSTNNYDAIITNYSKSVLNKWSMKISNSSGSTAINSNKFKSINQSADQQVENNLNDMERLIKKTKLNRRSIKPLAFDIIKKLQDDEQKKQEQEQDAEEDDEDLKNPDLPNNLNLNSKSSNSIIELNSIFDDEDFYRILLNDLVDKKIQSTNPSNGLTIAIKLAQKLSKLNKNIDTKASKGRKLRYHIQEEISNFETPHDGWKWNDDQIDEFFASLLGQKVNMNEIEETGGNDEEESDDDLMANNDGIKLFG